MRNLQLIEYHRFTTPEWYEVEYLSTSDECQWDVLRSHFADLRFSSMVKDGPWEKYTKTFPMGRGV
jgi:hypothetical protein